MQRNVANKFRKLQIDSRKADLLVLKEIPKNLNTLFFGLFLLTMVTEYNDKNHV